MPQYSGDQIYQGGGTVSPLAQNYRKTTGSSNFGTRKLAWYRVQMDPDFGLAATYDQPNSLFFQIVRALQRGSEQYGGNYEPTSNGNIAYGAGGGGVELFYLGVPQNSSSSPENTATQGFYSGLKYTNTETLAVSSASSDGSIITLTFTTPQSTPPFQVGASLFTDSIGHGFDVGGFNSGVSVIACTTTYVQYYGSSTAGTFTGLSGASVIVDLGYDSFVFAIHDDAEEVLPEGQFALYATGTTGTAGDIIYYCGSGRSYTCTWPSNLIDAIQSTLAENDLSTSSFWMDRLDDAWAIIPNYQTYL